MSRYKYGNKKSVTSTKRNLRNEIKQSCNDHIDYDEIANEVYFIKERLEAINTYLEDISDLSSYVQEELGDIENSVTVLEDLI